MSKNIQKIIRLIERCPSWVGIKNNDTKRKLILNNLMIISKYPIDDIEKSISQCVKYKIFSKNFDPAYMEKIYLLNRYLFDVPKFVPRKNRKVFSGFSGMPSNDRLIGEMWPLDFDKNGNLIIVGSEAMYNGPLYRADIEFRYFKTVYGLRRHKI